MADTAQPTTNAQQPAPAPAVGATATNPAPAQTAPATPPDPNNPNPPASTPPPQTQNKPSKKPKIFFIISLLMLIIGIVSLVFSLFNMKKKPAENKGKEDKTAEASSSATPSQTNAAPTPTTPPAPTLSLNKGYEIKNTACYSLQVPTASSIVDENSCLVKIFKSFEKYTYNLILEPEYNDYKNSQGMYENYQKIVKDGSYVFKNEEKIKIGGLEAIKVYQESKSTKIPTKMILVFVSNAGKYKNRESSISGFQISAVYNAASKSKTEEVLNTITESLNWK